MSDRIETAPGAEGSSLDLISHPLCHAHAMGPGHPEQPARLEAIDRAIAGAGLEPRIRRVEAPEASREALLRVHTAAHLERIFNAAPTSGLAWLDGDTAMNPHSLKAALHAAGAAVLAVERICAGAARRAFCAVRPPGHHAERERAMGFCLFNNIAIAARHALEAGGLERVAIVDFDVHHGNGTEDAVANDPRILFCSSFEHPLYPYRGADSTASNLINLPLPAGTRGADLIGALERHALPRIRDFQPQLLLISAGFDGHASDPLAGFRLREPDYYLVTRRLVEIAEASAEGRVVSLLEGGYDLNALGASLVAHLRALLDDPWMTRSAEPQPQIRSQVQ